MDLMAANNNKFDYIKNYIASRQIAKDLLDKIEKKVIKKCYYCQRCENCTKFKTYKLEFEKKKVFGHLINILGGGMFMILILAKETLYLSFNQ